MRRKPFAVAVGAVTLSCWAGAAFAAPPQLVAGTLNMFRDYRGANSTGNGAGDKLQYGADIVGGSNNVFLSAVSATGFADASAPCSPLQNLRNVKVSFGREAMTD